MNKALCALRVVTDKDNWCSYEESSKRIPDIAFETIDKLLKYKLPRYTLQGVFDGTINLSFIADSYHIEVITDGLEVQAIFVSPSKNGDTPEYFSSLHGVDEGSIAALAKKINTFVQEHDVEYK